MTKLLRNETIVQQRQHHGARRESDVLEQGSSAAIGAEIKYVL